MKLNWFGPRVKLGHDHPARHHWMQGLAPMGLYMEINAQSFNRLYPLKCVVKDTPYLLGFIHLESERADWPGDRIQIRHVRLSVDLKRSTD